MARELRLNFQIPENFEFPEVLPRTLRQQQIMADPNAAAVVVAVPETWHVNPYHQKFNLSLLPRSVRPQANRWFSFQKSLDLL